MASDSCHPLCTDLRRTRQGAITRCAKSNVTVYSDVILEHHVKNNGLGKRHSSKELSTKLGRSKLHVIPQGRALLKREGKGKVHPRTGHEGPKGEQRYSATLSLTPALDGGGWSTPRPGRFIRGERLIPIV